MLFAVWNGSAHRPTSDLDFLSFGSSEIEILTEIIRRICSSGIEEDGVVFQLDSIRGETIKAKQEYEGVRVHVSALNEKTCVPLRIDFGFGDAVQPPAEEVEYPMLLDFPNPKIKIYGCETAIAEKFHAIRIWEWRTAGFRIFTIYIF